MGGEPRLITQIDREPLDLPCEFAHELWPARPCRLPEFGTGGFETRPYVCLVPCRQWIGTPLHLPSSPAGDKSGNDGFVPYSAGA